MATGINLLSILIGFLPILIFAVGGLWDAINKGEKVNWPSFIKTLVVGLVTAGIISMQTGDLINEVAATTAVTLVLDKLLNALLRKDVEAPKVITPPTNP